MREPLPFPEHHCLSLGTLPVPGHHWLSLGTSACSWALLPALGTIAWPWAPLPPLGTATCPRHYYLAWAPLPAPEHRHLSWQWGFSGQQIGCGPGGNSTSTTCLLCKFLNRTCIIKERKKERKRVRLWGFLTEFSLGLYLIYYLTYLSISYFYFNNHTFPLKIYIWFFVISASLAPHPCHTLWFLWMTWLI